MPDNEFPKPQRQTPNTRALVREIPNLPRRSRVAGYAIAIGLAAAALALTLVFLPWLERSVFLLFWPAVFAAAWLGGFGPAALTAVLAVLLVDMVIIPPAMTLRTTDPRDMIGLLGFLLIGGISAWVIARLQRARSATAEAAQENANLAKLLDEQGEELAQQLEEAQSMQEELEASTEELAERTAEAESADRFTRGILESIADPFVVYDAEWRFRYINAAAERVFENTGSEVTRFVGAVVWEIWPELIGTKTEKEMRRAAIEMVPTTFEAFDQASGTWAELYCYPLPDGGLGVQWKDITQRKRIEESTRYLSRASELLASSLDYEQTLRSIARLVVPRLAAFAILDVVDDHDVMKRLDVVHRDEAKQDVARRLRDIPLDWSRPHSAQQAREYATAYSKILTARRFSHIYIDAFAGAGLHVARVDRRLRAR